MVNKITKQLGLIEEALNWISQTKSMSGAKGSQARKNLVDYRRKLKRKLSILDSNPAVAIFGESQQGKSYLVSSLLSLHAKPFTIEDGNNKSYDFINEINPIGKDAESTGVVTRFSTSYEWINPNYPVQAKLLSVSDLILVLSDSYFNDIKVKADSIFKTEHINDRLKIFEDKYSESSLKQVNLSEDDIYEIQDYFILNFSSKASGINHSDFFKSVPKFISKVPSKDRAELFSLLWNGNVEFTQFLEQLIQQLSLLDFSSEIYLPIEAVLRNFGTIVDVTRLREIFNTTGSKGPNYIDKTNVLYCSKDNFSEFEGFSKPFLSALTAELVFKLPKNLEEFKPFLAKTDLLDFPGARRREEVHENDITEKKADLLLRGKVSYLFNKYSHDEKINILMLCHADKMSGQSVLPGLIDEWIGKMIGTHSNSRSEFLSNLEVPPFFVISTMFNKDLHFELGRDNEDDLTNLNYRWEKRFSTVLRNEVFSGDVKTWLENWSEESSNFQNIFLLRDYYFSSEASSNIFKGYNENKMEMEEVEYPSFPTFRKELRDSFLNNAFVKKHFKSPELSWDEAATINKDGTELIIKNLTAASENINEANNQKNLKILNEISEGVSYELKKYFHDSSSDERLKKAKEKAGVIQRKMAIAFGRDPYFFGRMMRDFTIKESEVLRLYKEKIDDVDSRPGVISDHYFAIRISVPELNPNDSFDVNLERLRSHYEISTASECIAQFENDGIELNELFFGNIQKIKNLAQVLSEALGEFWFKHHLASVHSNLSKVFSDSDIEDLLEMFNLLFEKLKISETITSRIRKYLDDTRGMENIYEMIANISAEILNRFINTVGNAYINQEALVDIRRANVENNLGLVLEHESWNYSDRTAEYVGQLISNVANSSDLLNQNPLPQEAYKLPFLKNYLVWSDLLKVGFVSVNDIPNYDVQANEKLKLIIEQTSQINYN